MDVARADGVDGKLDRTILKQASQDQRPDPDEREGLWKEGARPYNARRREEMRAAGGEYHQGQAARHRAVLESLIACQEEETEKSMDIEPKG